MHVYITRSSSLYLPQFPRIKRPAMKSFPTLSSIQRLHLSFATLFFLSLLLHALFSGIHLHRLLSPSPFLSLSCACCLLLSIFYFFRTRPPPVFLLNYACFKPDVSRRCTLEVSEYFVRRNNRFSPESEAFMRGIYLKSGLGDETYGPKFMFEDKCQTDFAYAIDEAREGMFSAVDAVLSKTLVSAGMIDVVVIASGGFSPAPSLSSLLVNRYELKPDVKTFNLGGMGCSAGLISADVAARILRSGGRCMYALVVVIESVTPNWYLGDNRSMLVTNCIFRVGCAAALMTNDRALRQAAKLELTHSLRTHHGADDRAFRAAFQEEDAEGRTGVALTKDLIRVASLGLHQHIKQLAPRVLPLSQLAQYLYHSVITAGGESKPMIPDFTTAFEHLCIHTGGKAVIEKVGRVLKLGEWVTEPARMTLHRFGNTSASLVFYELAYFEAKGRVKKGERMWMLAFGTGFKVCSLVWKCLQDSPSHDFDNPWTDCIHRYPLNAW